MAKDKPAPNALNQAVAEALMELDARTAAPGAERPTPIIKKAVTALLGQPSADAEPDKA